MCSFASPVVSLIISSVVVKMSRETIVSAFLLGLTSTLIFVDAQILGGYSPMPPTEYGDLVIQLDKSNMASALNKREVFIIQITSALQQVVAGLNFKIVAKTCVECSEQMCCFKAFQNLSGNFSVECAQCNYNGCECFN